MSKIEWICIQMKICPSINMASVHRLALVNWLFMDDTRLEQNDKQKC